MPVDEVTYKFKVVRADTWPSYKGIDDFIHTVQIGCVATYGDRMIKETQKVAIFKDGQPLPEDFESIFTLFKEVEDGIDNPRLLQWALKTLDETKLAAVSEEFMGDYGTHLRNWKRRMRRRLIDPSEWKPLHSRRHRETYTFDPNWAKKLEEEA